MAKYLSFALVAICLQVVYSRNVLQEARRLGAKTLEKLVKDAGLEETLSGEGPFTLFAPSEKAFGLVPVDVLKQLEEDKALLTKVLTYHVVSGNVTSDQLKNDEVVDTVEGTSKIRVNIYDKTITINGAKVILADKGASNGVVHVIDRVLYPLPTQDIVEFAASSETFSQLVYLVGMAELVDTLKGGPFTLFAPTDDAFSKVPSNVINELLMNITALQSVLEYHLVSGTTYSVGLSDGQKIEAVNKGELTVEIAGGNVKINDATVVTADMTVTNGVIHVIDTVLLPPSYRTT